LPCPCSDEHLFTHHIGADAACGVPGRVKQANISMAQVEVHLSSKGDIRQTELDLGQGRRFLSGMIQACLPPARQCLSASVVSDDFCPLKEVCAVDVVGMMMCVDDIAHAVWPKLFLDKCDDLSRFARKRQRVDDDGPFFGEQNRRYDLDIQVAHEYIDVLGNPVHSQLQRLPFMQPQEYITMGFECQEKSIILHNFVKKCYAKPLMGLSQGARQDGRRSGTAARLLFYAV